MEELDIISKAATPDYWKIPKPIFRKKREIQEVLCQDIAKYKDRQRKKDIKKPSRILAKSEPKGEGPLDKFFKR